MARIFMCHASEDKPQVREVYQRLKAVGFDPWLDEENLLPGQDWDYEIEQALETADFVMVFLSTRSVEKIGYVQREFRWAMDRSTEMPEGLIHTIPVKLDACTVPRRFSHYQWADLSEAGAFDRIVRALHRGLEQRGLEPPASEPSAVLSPAASAPDPVGPGESEPAVLAEPAPAARTIRTEPALLAASPPAPVPGLQDTLADGSPGPAMVWLPGGVFRMGDDRSSEADEKPAHEVAVEAFSISQYPVTFDAYEAFCRATGRETPDDRGWGRDTRPVIRVSWEDAAAYCEWLAEQTAERYRLPTEAEWEYACRAGHSALYSFGDDAQQLGDYAWYVENADDQTHPVGEKGPNDWDLYDMHGNVWEWVQDWYARDYYARSPRENPSGPEMGSIRVIRGGGWYYDAAYCRSASRSVALPAYRYAYLGFRLARDGPWPSNALTLGAPAEAHTPAPKETREVEPQPDADRYPGVRDRLQDGTETPEMVVLPGGTFQMGDIQGTGWEDERPVHTVTLAAFAIGRYPVTVGDYLRFVEATGRHHPAWLEAGSSYHIDTGEDDYYRRAGVGLDQLDHPVVGISWEDAAAYCEWLSRQTAATYELPTEAQWEYACRAGRETAYSFGDTVGLLGDHAWYVENAEGRLHPVGQKRANPWGLYDMHGNVWEWVRDWYGDYSEEPQSDPSGPETGSLRVIRGGSWFNDAAYCRSATRYYALPALRDGHLGFRLARRV